MAGSRQKALSATEKNTKQNVPPPLPTSPHPSPVKLQENRILILLKIIQSIFSFYIYTYNVKQHD